MFPIFIAPLLQRMRTTSMKTLMTSMVLLMTLAVTSRGQVLLVDEDPFYEVVTAWPGAFKANFCLTAPQDFYGWKLQIHFDQPVEALEITRATVRARNDDSTVFHLGDRFWNARWLSGERNCFDFTATTPGIDSGAQANRVFFSEIVQPTGCPSQVSEQQFSLTVARHWSQGISGIFCLTAPRDFNGGWNIRFEFDRYLLRLMSSKTNTYDVTNRRHWRMSPKPGYEDLTAGEQFCADFIAFTRRLVSPCIRAFFTEEDGITPANSTLPTKAPPPSPPDSTQAQTTLAATTTTTADAATTITTPTTTTTVPTTTTTTATTTTQPTTATTTKPTTTTSATTTTTTPTTTTSTTQASNWGGVYTQNSLWNAGVSGRLCLDHAIDITCGWEIDIRFDPAVDRLDIWIGTVTTTVSEGSANVIRVVNKNYNLALTDNPVCYDFNAYKSYNHGPQVTGRFARICSNGKWNDVTSGGSGSGGGDVVNTATTTSTTTTTQPPQPTTTTTTAATTTTTTTTKKDGTSYTGVPTTTDTNRPSTARYDYGDALSKSLLFYMAQRSGPLPDDVIPWRGDSAVDDGTTGADGQWRDLTGGWYDAGDFLKLNFPMAGTTTVLLWGLRQFPDGFAASGQLQRMREVVRWPLDYFLKCWDAENQIYYGHVGKVSVDHAYWGRPEEMTMDRPVYTLTTSDPGSDLAAETAAALTVGYLVFRDTDAGYANQLLEAAKTLYTFADSYRGYYHDSIPDAESAYKSWGYQDELCWGAAWLYNATGESHYLDKARAAADAAGVLSSSEFSWDDKGPACAVLLHEVDPDSSRRQQYSASISAFTQGWRTSTSTSVTPCGLSWLRQWGSLRYALNAGLVAVMAAEQGLESSANRAWALSQLNFALGDNEQQRSYVVGFGVNPPERPHHAASSCPDVPAECDWDEFNSPEPNPQVLTGALVGGPDVSGNYVDDRTNYVMNEVACDYNAAFTSVLAAMQSLDKRGQLPVADPTCPGPGGGSSSSGSSPTPPLTPQTTTQFSGPTNLPDKSGTVNQAMVNLYLNTYTGDGTYYGYGQEGTCTYHQGTFPAVGTSSDIDALAAINHIIWHNSKACGMCFKVTGSGNGLGSDPIMGEYIVFIKDLCPAGSCNKEGSVDFAQDGDGRWFIEVQAVQCPVADNTLQYSFQGSNPWYLKLQVANYRLPVDQVSIERNGQWEVMTKTNDGYWLLGDGVEMTNTVNIPVRLTAINGEVLHDTIPQLVSGVTMEGGQQVQFALDPSLPSA